MQRREKERIVEELAESLRQTDTLIVADYRGLSMKEIDALRGELLQHGARFRIVKNSLTRRAAEAAEADAVLALLEGPTAIAFLESEGDAVAVAKALAETARTTNVLALRGGILEGRVMSADDVEELAKLPPLDALRGQVLAAVAAPLYAIVGLFSAPLQDLHGLIEARIDQLGGEDATAAEAQPAAVAEAGEEPKGEAAPETEAQAAAEVPADGDGAEGADEETTDEQTSEAAEEPTEAESEEE